MDEHAAIDDAVVDARLKVLPVARLDRYARLQLEADTSLTAVDQQVDLDSSVRAIEEKTAAGAVLLLERHELAADEKVAFEQIECVLGNWSARRRKADSALRGIMREYLEV